MIDFLIDQVILHGCRDNPGGSQASKAQTGASFPKVQ